MMERSEAEICSILLIFKHSKRQVSLGFAGAFDKLQPREAIHGTVRASQEKRDFDPEKFLATIGAGEVVAFPKRQTIFCRAMRMTRSSTSRPARSD